MFDPSSYNMQNNTIVIATSAQPAANPRAVKEALSLHDAGYNIVFVYCAISPWANEMDAEIFDANPGIRWMCATKKGNDIRYTCIRLRRKFFEKLYAFTTSPKHAVYASALYAQDLKKICSGIPAGHYRAHNLGALPAVLAASAKYNSRYSFDAEDFHRGESDDQLQQQKVKIIEDFYFKNADSLTVAAPLALQFYNALYPGKQIRLINNVFPLSMLSKQEQKLNRPLRLFWFSQTIGPKRGLEILAASVQPFTGRELEVCFLGNVSEGYKDHLKKIFPVHLQPKFLPPVAPDKIFAVAETMDIGLASETAFSENNNIALSNKLFTYLSAGLMILASDTEGQQQFIEQNQGAGMLYEKLNPESLQACLKQVIHDPAMVLACRKKALQLAQKKYNWEAEIPQLLASVIADR